MGEDIGLIDFSGVDSNQARDMLECRLIEIGWRSPTKAECTDAPTVTYFARGTELCAVRGGRIFVWCYVKDGEWGALPMPG